MITAVDQAAAHMVRRVLDDRLEVLSSEDLLVRAVDTHVVLLFNAAPTTNPHEFIDGANELISELAADGWVLDDDDDGWRWLVDGTGSVNATLGTDDEALKTFLDLLPGTSDSLSNLARVAVSISTPTAGRTAAPQAPPVRVVVPSRPDVRTR